MHDIIYNKLHFEGCGIDETLCTAYSACDDIRRLGFGRGSAAKLDTQENQACTDRVEVLELYS